MKLRRQMIMKASGCSSAHTDRQEMNMNVEKISNPQWADK
ncbi:TPA: DUF4376 domain-containing protein, partial [Escherichia coli]|nr:DUF4376 domain-containing protein [Escherichia coli]